MKSYIKSLLKFQAFNIIRQFQNLIIPSNIFFDPFKAWKFFNIIHPPNFDHWSNIFHRIHEFFWDLFKRIELALINTFRREINFFFQINFIYRNIGFPIDETYISWRNLFRSKKFVKSVRDWFEKKIRQFFKTDHSIRPYFLSNY